MTVSTCMDYMSTCQMKNIGVALRWKGAKFQKNWQKCTKMGFRTLVMMLSCPKLAKRVLLRL